MSIHRDMGRVGINTEEQEQMRASACVTILKAVLMRLFYIYFGLQLLVLLIV